MQYLNIKSSGWYHHRAVKAHFAGIYIIIARHDTKDKGKDTNQNKYWLPNTIPYLALVGELLGLLF